MFLAAVTIAIVLVRAGLDSSNGGGSPSVVVSTASPTTKPATTGRARRTPKRPKRRFYVIQSGDTFGTVAAKFGTTIEALQALNPDTSSNSLTVGQRIRVK